MATVPVSPGPSSENPYKVSKTDVTVLSINNDLTSLIKVAPADPVVHLKLEDVSDDNEQYIPQESTSDWSSPTKESLQLSRIREKFNSKVKTVAQIRKKYETYITAEILLSLENTEQKILEIVKRKARFSQPELDNLVNTKNPMSRAAWVLSTLSKHKKQYLCDGSSIYRLSGSNSEESRTYIFKDVSIKNKVSLVSNEENIDKCKTLLPKTCLLKQSLDLSFKPGPRSKKPFLDVSHQRHNIGKSMLLNMPLAGIQLSTGFNLQLDRYSCRFLTSHSQSNELINDKYAEFAASAFYTKGNRNEIESHVFPIRYDENRKKLLVRQDCEISWDFKDKSKPNSNVDNELAGLDADLEFLNNYKPLDAVESDIKSVINDMLKSVSISLVQDHIGKRDSDKDISKEELDILAESDENNTVKERKIIRRKRNCGFYEFRKLGMTVINVDEDGGNHICIPQCQLGCIDLNAKCFVNVRCSHVDCMFEDHCLFTSMREDENIEIPLQAMNLQFQATKNLAKEELKFHQTVIFSNKETIVMRANQHDIRNKRPADTVPVKIPPKKKRFMVVLQRLPEFHSVEVWCMIHQLYRCFCKGRFIEGNPFKLSVNNLKSEEIYYPMIHETPLSNSVYFNNAKLETAHKTKEKPSIISQGSKLKNNSSVKNILKMRRNIKKMSESLMQQYKKMDKPVKICPFETNLIIEETDNTIKEMNIDINMRMRRKRHSRNSVKHSKTDKSNKVEPSVSTLNVSTDQANILSNNTTPTVNKNKSSNSFDSFVNEILTKKKHSSPMTQSKKEIWIASSLKGKETMNRGQPEYLNWLNQQIQKAVQLRRDRADFSQLLYDKTKRLIVCPWNDLLSMYIKNKFSFYISKNQPYKLYFSEKQVPVENCVNVRTLPLYNLDEYPPFVKKILFKLMIYHNFVIISVKPDAPIWEIIGEINKDNRDGLLENDGTEGRNNVEDNSLNFDDSNSGIPNNDGSLPEENSLNDNSKEDVPNEGCKGKDDIPATKKSPKGKKEPLAIKKKTKGGDGVPMRIESFEDNEDIIASKIESLEGKEDIPVANESFNSKEDLPVKNESFDGKLSLLKIRSVDEVNKGLETLKEEIKENYKISLLKNEAISNDKTSKDELQADNKISLANTISRLENKLMLPHSVSTGEKIKMCPVIKRAADGPINAFRYALPTNFENSKWFKMTIENDFVEMHIPSKGFSITYEFIDRAIDLADTNNKTVRFLAQPDSQRGSQPIFGMYAVPKVDGRCIFIGPYKPHEEAGVRTVTKDDKELGEQRTRGIWLFPRRIDIPQEKKITEDNSLAVVRNVTTKCDTTQNKNTESNSGNFITFDSFAENISVASTSNPVVAETKTSFPFANIIKLSESFAKVDHSKLPKISIKRNTLLANQGKVPIGKLLCPKITVKKMVPIFPGGTSILKPVSKDEQIDNINFAAETNEFPMCKITDVKSISPTCTPIIKTEKNSPVKIPYVVDTIVLNSSDDDDDEDKTNKDVPKNEVKQPAVEMIAGAQDSANIVEKNKSENNENINLKEGSIIQPSLQSPLDQISIIKLINKRSLKNMEENQTDSHKKRRESDTFGDILMTSDTTIPLDDKEEKPSKNMEKVKIKSHGSKKKITISTFHKINQEIIASHKTSDDSNDIQAQVPEQKEAVKKMSEHVKPNNEVNNAVEVSNERKDGESPAGNPVYMMSDRVKDLGYIIGTRMKDSTDIQFSFPGSKEINTIHEQSLCEDLNRLTSARITFVPRDLELKWRIFDSLDVMSLWSPMQEEHVDGNHVLTNSGLHKMDLQERCDEIKSAFDTLQSLILPGVKTPPNMEKWTLINMAKESIRKLQKMDEAAAVKKQYLKKCILHNKKILKKTRCRVEELQKKRTLEEKNKNEK